MKIKYITCPACSTKIRVTDPDGKYSCDSCGHMGVDTEGLPTGMPEVTYDDDLSTMQGLRYTVDIVMCIDSTASMKHLIDQVKNNALRFYDDLKGVMEAKSKVIDQLRVKVISFRDYFHDGKNAMIESEFFILPEDQSQFASFINTVRASGGGNLPESGLEAIALAMKSDWSVHGDKKRHIIIVWTDASTHPLEKDSGRKPRHYPGEMPRNLNELTDLWEDNPALHAYTKRLIIFAPDKFAWSDISSHWSNTIQYPSTAGYGLSSLDYQTILDAIANSV